MPQFRSLAVMLRMNAINRLSRQRGQALLESALVVLVFIATLISIFDFSQVLFFHQSLVERVRSATRAAVVRAYDETDIKNRVLYGTPTAGSQPFLGLTPANVSVQLLDAGTANERIRVAIVDYKFHLFSPWIARSFTNNLAVIQVLPVEYEAP